MRNFLLSTISLVIATLLSTGCAPAPSAWIRTADLGSNSGCYIDSRIDGLQCWGANGAGQSSPPGLTTATQVSVGDDFACALDNANLICWGNSPAGALTLSNPSSLSAGDNHVCVLDDNGVNCLGGAAQTTVPVLNNPTEISASGDRTCAIDGDNVQCWGDNTDSLSLSNPSHIATGPNHVCVLAGGQVHCAGSESGVVNQTPNVSNPIGLASSEGYACVIDSSTATCWGDSGLAVLDVIPDMTLPTQIMAGGNGLDTHACVRHLQGIKCWGDNNQNQLAVYDGNTFHGITAGVAEIEATPAEVWTALMDLDSYPLWNPFTTSVESNLGIGDPVTMTVQFAIGALVQVENVRFLTPDYKVCWGIDDGNRWDVTGERCQWLELLPNGNTLYTTHDLIEGSLAPTTYSLFGTDLIVGFQGVADGLKAYVESL